ncbi:ComEA family DNA-binding protein [Thermomicrobium sp. CFH 73360]|uniref:ComEA family DNA-binding protein n=1 Tax=Thermomicrobium sp. CFH 73360 TaxID=2951987 RepID=UPI0020771B77|nr:ComEA family DNA-binding protein [Thermomicrobium sp. CFH 73360]MCM8747098.1 ComEA family DNA-binding protein [Thermomicrobium sp. CFH 73360]
MRFRDMPARFGLLVGAALGMLIGFNIARHWSSEEDLILRIEPISTPSVIIVYVTGAVERPGLYTVPSDARVAQAVELAGPRVEADLAKIPMAERLRDGQTVEVPVRQGPDVQVTPGAASEGIPSRAGPVPQDETIDVNRATVAELERLPGVGPALAQRIVAYREEHGPFRSIEELAEVPGISARMVAEWANLVTVGSSTE